MNKLKLAFIAFVALFSSCTKQDNDNLENTPVTEKMNIDQMIAQIDQCHRDALKEKYSILKERVQSESGDVKMNMTSLFIADLVGQEVMTMPPQFFMDGLSVYQSNELLYLYPGRSFVENLNSFGSAATGQNNILCFQKDCVVGYMNAFDSLLDLDNPDYENLDYDAAFALYNNQAKELYNTIRVDNRLSDAEKVMLLSMIEISAGSLEVWPVLLAEQGGTKGFWSDTWKKAKQYAKADALGAVGGIVASYPGIIAAGVATGGTGAVAAAGTAALKGAVVGSLMFGITDMTVTWKTCMPVHPIVVRYKSGL